MFGAGFNLFSFMVSVIDQGSLHARWASLCKHCVILLNLELINIFPLAVVWILSFWSC
jgi:hypothetical protein